MYTTSVIVLYTTHGFYILNSNKNTNQHSTSSNKDKEIIYRLYGTHVMCRSPIHSLSCGTKINMYFITILILARA